MESKANKDYSDAKYMCIDNNLYRCKTVVQYVMTKDKYDGLIDENEKLKEENEKLKEEYTKLKTKSKRLYAALNKNKNNK